MQFLHAQRCSPPAEQGTFGPPRMTPHDVAKHVVQATNYPNNRYVRTRCARGWPSQPLLNRWGAALLDHMDWRRFRNAGLREGRVLGALVSKPV